jgi:predicted Ser/Thr protein kinase
MGTKTTIQSTTKSQHDVPVKVLRAWTKPYPDCDPSTLRPKTFKVVRLNDGRLAFCKMDTSPEYVVHEVSILEILDELDCVPSLICRTPNAVFTTYVKGRLVSEAVKDLGVSACINVGWQILRIVANIHKKDVVHGDIRPWNFIYGKNARLYLIDFEYAYSIYETSKAAHLLRNHHGQSLKTPFHDWIDAWYCVAMVWRSSSHRCVKDVLVCIPQSIGWLMHCLRCLRSYFLAPLRICAVGRIIRKLRNTFGHKGEN